MAQNAYFDPIENTQNTKPIPEVIDPKTLREPFEVVGSNTTTQQLDSQQFNQPLNSLNSAQPESDYNYPVNKDQDQYANYNGVNNYTNYESGNQDLTYNQYPEYQQQYMGASKKINFILPVILGTLSILFFTAWILEKNNSKFAISAMLGIGKPQIQKIVSSQTDTSGYQACAASGGKLELTLPRSCFLNDIYYFETIPNGDIEAYKKNLEMEGSLKNAVIFNPKNYARFDKIIDNNAIIPGTTTYTLKESNQLTYKMEVYSKLEADSKPEIKAPQNYTAKIDGLTDLKGYDTAVTYAVSPKNAVLGDVNVYVYAVARDNYVVLSAPLRGNEKLLAIAQKCLNKKYEVDSSYQDKLQQCFNEEVQKDSGSLEAIKEVANKLLDTFQL